MVGRSDAFVTVDSPLQYKFVEHVKSKDTKVLVE